MNELISNKHRKLIRSLAQSSGKIAMKYRKNLETLQVDAKSEKDLVTEADRAIESYIKGRIQKTFPSHTIIGEEEGTVPGDDYQWVIDPIDGTVSFAHGMRHFSISICLRHGKNPLLGVVYAPALDEFYFAEAGKGATCNGKPIHVSRRDGLGSSVMATGFACLRSQLEENNLPYFNTLVPQLRCVRRYGSAAYDLALTAAGKIEGFWELNLNDYDVAAGILLVTEAGGRVSNFSGGQDGVIKEILATNGLVHDAVMEIFRGVNPE